MKKKPIATFGDVMGEVLSQLNSKNKELISSNNIDNHIVENSYKHKLTEKHNNNDANKLRNRTGLEVSVYTKKKVSNASPLPTLKPDIKTDVKSSFKSKKNSSKSTKNKNIQKYYDDKNRYLESLRTLDKEGVENSHNIQNQVQIKNEKVLEKLPKISADIAKLKITGSKSKFKKDLSQIPVIDDPKGSLAILGLDFGTAFTKAVIRYKRNHYAVDWSESIDNEDKYLLSSIFSEHDNGTCVLGTIDSDGWKSISGIKLKIISSDNPKNINDMVDAVIFLGLTFRYAECWFKSIKKNDDSTLRWNLHVGLPALSWDDSELTESFKKISQAAKLLAVSAGPITRIKAINAIENWTTTERPFVDVFPEFACQLYSYLQSPERQSDVHGLIDIGAGTIDFAFFNIHLENDETMIPIFASDVKNLGAHYLIAASIGRKGESIQWKDAASSFTAEKFAEILNENPEDVKNRQKVLLSSIADVFNSVAQTAKNAYGTSPAYRQGAPIRLFFCGGGSRINCFKERIQLITDQSHERMRIRYQLSSLVKPKDIVGDIGDSFDRLSVAYGLSQSADNIGTIIRSKDLVPIRVENQIYSRHRDDDR